MNQTEHVAAIVVDEPVDGVAGFFRKDSAAVQEILRRDAVYRFLRTDTVGVVGKYTLLRMRSRFRVLIKNVF